VRGASPSADPDLGRQRKVLDAFMAAARGGEFEALLAVLDPDVVLRADAGPLVRGAAASKVVRGARPVAEQAMLFRQFVPNARFLLLNDGIGVANVVDGRVISLMGVTVTDGRITEMFILADPERLARLDLGALDGN
jgi:RNA polymerase sigma-70 factor (ECF subfamily)